MLHADFLGMVMQLLLGFQGAGPDAKQDSNVAGFHFFNTSVTSLVLLKGGRVGVEMRRVT